MRPKIFLFLRLIAAGILLQTLYFKFTAAPESVYIFRTLQMEPWGRWLSGVSELIASIFLIIPATQLLGALLAAGIMTGAILSHLLFLGISVQGDGGVLFGLAVIVFTISLIIIMEHRHFIMSLIKNIRGKNV